MHEAEMLPRMFGPELTVTHKTLDSQYGRLHRSLGFLSLGQNVSDAEIIARLAAAVCRSTDAVARVSAKEQLYPDEKGNLQLNPPKTSAKRTLDCCQVSERR